MSGLSNYFKRKRPAASMPEKRQKLESAQPSRLLPVPQSNIINGDSIEENQENEVNILESQKPTSVEDLVGNKSQIDNLRKWLLDWDKVHLHKTKKVPFSKQNPGSKCALISGPPGIGKTTAAHLIATSNDFEVFELNASDARSKRLIQDKVSDALVNSTISFKGLSLKDGTQLNRRKVIVMDEVDGMSSEDRGGMQELMKLIKSSKVPVICICNDRAKASVRSLAAASFDLRFQRPNKLTLQKWLLNVARKHKVAMLTEANAQHLVASSSGDVRQLLNALDFMRAQSQSQSMDNASASTSAMELIKKDAVLSVDHSAATQYIFNESQNESTFRRRFDAFFVSYDLIPLLVADHYPTAVRNGCKNAVLSSGVEGQLESLQCLSRAADAVCDADILGADVMLKQQWSLLPSCAALNLRAARHAKGKIGFAGFPTWLSKISSQKRKQRLVSTLELHTRQFIGSGTSTVLRTDCLDLLKTLSMRPLKVHGKSGVQQCLENMESCGLSRDDVLETFQEVSLERESSTKFDFDKLESSTKREFTRLYNKNSHRSQILTRESEVKERRLKRKK